VTTAGGTGLPDKQIMIEINVGPIRGADMAGNTGQGGLHMLGHGRLAGGDGPVVTGLAGIGGLTVRKGQDQRQPGAARVTGLTHITG
jgi:hypothetical protein